MVIACGDRGSKPSASSGYLKSHVVASTMVSAANHENILHHCRMVVSLKQRRMGCLVTLYEMQVPNEGGGWIVLQMARAIIDMRCAARGQGQSELGPRW
jgi:hypothetical protein